MLATLEHEAIALDQSWISPNSLVPSIGQVVLPSEEDIISYGYKGEFAGVAMMARDFAPFIEYHWPNQRVKGVAAGIAESHLRVGAYNINYVNGHPSTIDCGMMQDNVSISSELIDRLKTVSTDPRQWIPVVKYNVWYAYQLWATRTVFRDGKLDFRRWSPWVAVTGGWAWHPRCWVYHHDKDGNAIGPWVKAGEYLMKAIRGVANYDLLHHEKSPKEVLAWARLQAKQFGIKEDWCVWDYTEKKYVYYIPETIPFHVPTAAENYGYPVHNDGR